MLQVVAYWVGHLGIQPSYGEIARQLGYRSKGYIHAMVRSLRRKGVVRTRPRFLGLIFDWQSYLPEGGVKCPTAKKK
jgi:SOS-response transcriptional repressor LexA